MHHSSFQLMTFAGHRTMRPMKEPIPGNSPERGASPIAAQRHVTGNAPATFPNTSLTSSFQSPLFPQYSLDKNKRRTYKNIIATREMQMLTFIKDFAAFVTLGAFTIGSLTWMDVLARLV